MELGLDAWLTLAALVVMFVALVREALGPDLVLFTTVTFLWVTGVIQTDQAVAGFSNPQVLTVGLLFIVAAAVKDTGALRLLIGPLLQGHPEGVSGRLRLLVPTALLSAFLNNTPIVAMLIPEVRSWAARAHQPPSRFLIPLSYMAILGGTCTLIGTSTNLLISGLMESNGMAPLSMFELAAVGLPATLVGLLFLITLGRRLLPDRVAPDEAKVDVREFSSRLLVLPGCPWIGMQVGEAGLRHLEGLFLVEIARGERRIVPVRPTNLIMEGDRLTFVGVADTVVELLRTPGLAPLTDHEDEEEVRRTGRQSVVHEIVIPERSQLIGQNLRQVRFRRRYDAAVIAIHRGGHRLLQKLGDVELRAGDTLLLEASMGFRATWGRSGDFVILGVPTELPRGSLGWRTLVILLLMIGGMSTGLVPTVEAAAVSVVLLLLLRCIPVGRARSSMDLSVLILMASSFGLSAAVENSGLAQAAATLFSELLGGLGPLAALAAVYLLCVVVTETLSNAAAAALVFPVALATAAGLGLDPRPFAVAVTVAASMSFVTPLGYQTNLLVYGPGGYRFSDFTRVGLPMTLLVFAVAMICIPWFWPLAPR